MLIRRLTADDAEPFWQVRLRALLQFPEAFGGSYEESVQTPIEKVRERFSGSDDRAIFGAFDGHGRLVGTTGIYGDTAVKLRHKAMIWGVYVAPEQHGRGLGRLLLDAALAYARTVPHWEQVRLTVVAGNAAAKKLYVSLGFEVYGVEKRALRLGDSYLDEELMVLALH